MVHVVWRYRAFPLNLWVFQKVNFHMNILLWYTCKCDVNYSIQLYILHCRLQVLHGFLLTSKARHFSIGRSRRTSRGGRGMIQSSAWSQLWQIRLLWNCCYEACQLRSVHTPYLIWVGRCSNMCINPLLYYKDPSPRDPKTAGHWNPRQNATL